MKSRFLKLGIHIGGVNETTVLLAVSPFFEDGKAFMGLGGPVQIPTVPVETPSELDVLSEPLRIGHIYEGATQMAIGWVGFPKPLVAPKIRQPRVNAHSRPGSDQDGIGRADFFRGLF